MKNITKLVVSAVIAKVAIMFAVAMVTVASAQSVSAICDPGVETVTQQHSSNLDGIKGLPTQTKQAQGAKAVHPAMHKGHSSSWLSVKGS